MLWNEQMLQINLYSGDCFSSNPTANIFINHTFSHSSQYHRTLEPRYTWFLSMTTLLAGVEWGKNITVFCLSRFGKNMRSILLRDRRLTNVYQNTWVAHPKACLHCVKGDGVDIWLAKKFGRQTFIICTSLQRCVNTVVGLVLVTTWKHQATFRVNATLGKRLAVIHSMLHCGLSSAPALQLNGSLDSLIIAETIRSSENTTNCLLCVQDDWCKHWFLLEIHWDLHTFQISFTLVRWQNKVMQLFGTSEASSPVIWSEVLLWTNFCRIPSNMIHVTDRGTSRLSIKSTIYLFLRKMTVCTVFYHRMKGFTQ